MAPHVLSDKLKNMMDMKLSLGQVIAGSFTTVVTVTAIVVYVHSTFQSKADFNIAKDAAEREHEKIMKRIEKVEDSFQAQSQVQTQIFGDVKKISES